MSYREIPSCGTASPMEANAGEKIQSGEPGDCPNKGTSYASKGYNQGISVADGVNKTKLGTSESTIEDKRGGQGNA